MCSDRPVGLRAESYERVHGLAAAFAPHSGPGVPPWFFGGNAAKFHAAL